MYPTILHYLKHFYSLRMYTILSLYNNVSISFKHNHQKSIIILKWVSYTKVKDQVFFAPVAAAEINIFYCPLIAIS